MLLLTLLLASMCHTPSDFVLIWNECFLSENVVEAATDKMSQRTIVFLGAGDFKKKESLYVNML